LIAILTVLILIDFSLTLYIFFGFGLVYLAVVVCTRNVKKTGGALVATQTTNILRALHEGLGGIRDTLLAGNQKFYCEIYRAADKPLRSAQGKLQFISQSPKYVTEALAMIIISIAILLIAQREGGLLAIMPALAALILGAQRLLPVMQTAYASWTAITFSKDVLQDVLCLMSQPLGNFDSSEIIESIQFNRKIVLSNVSFKYANSESKILTNVNLTINKGDRIGIFGETGGGKSTLIDVIMGLLQPSNGSISVDGVEITPLNLRAWQKHIANVPQNIYLSDGTMAENIAFGLSESELDFKKVKIAAQKAQIANYIEGLPDGYDARCGERGASLSGGQIQRIGIARALYKNADVLVFDEATSALDSATENAIISFMESLDKDITIIIVAHRLATIRKCNKFFEIRKGREPRVCNHEDVFK
jgi:ATP-binding cassette subfamily B protein